MQKGKFSAGAALFVRILKKVDFPTFGTPNIPIYRKIMKSLYILQSEQYTVKTIAV